MNNGEFYVSGENRYIGENKSPPAEIYRKPFEENAVGCEISDLGQEVTYVQKKKSSGTKNADGSAKSLVDKVFNSLKSIATTATVAVSAVAVSTTLMSNTVSAELTSLDVGYDYVEYEIEISDMDDEDCFVVISSSGKTDVESRIDENGTQKARVDGLKPGWEYTLSVISRDEVLGDVTHFECKFQTKVHQEYSPDPPPDSYTGEYEVSGLEDAEVDWEMETVSVGVVFDSVGGKYYYKLILIDDKGRAVGAKTGDKTEDATLKLSDDASLYRLVFEIYGVGEAEEKLVLTEELGTINILKPDVNITDIRISGENRIRIEHTVLNADEVTLRVEYDGGYEDVVLGASELALGYTELTVPDTTKSVSVTPIISVDGYTLVREKVEKKFDINLVVEPVIYLNEGNMSIDFRIHSITNGATYLHVESDHPDIGAVNCYFFDGVANLSYTEHGQMKFTVYLTDDTGEKLSNEVSMTLDTTKPEVIEDYSYVYTNPGDIGVTYNDDGTINIYVDTQFECADESYYVELTVGRYRVRSRESIIELRNLPYDTYPIEYAVCLERDGIQYVLRLDRPSGTINETRVNASFELSGNLLTVRAWNECNIDLNNITIVSSDGQQIKISESDFVVDEYGEKTASVTFENAPEYVDIGVMAMHGKKTLDFVDEYVGNLYNYYEFSINQ